MSVGLVPHLTSLFRAIAIWSAIAVCSHGLCADEPLPAPEVGAVSADEALVKPLPVPAEKEKKQKLYIGLAALAGIVIVGVSLGALTLVWGSRLRRQLRKSDPAIVAVDRSFWFLKPPRPSITKSSLPELQRPLDDEPPHSPSDSDSQ